MENLGSKDNLTVLTVEKINLLVFGKNLITIALALILGLITLSAMYFNIIRNEDYISEFFSYKAYIVGTIITSVIIAIFCVVGSIMYVSNVGAVLTAKRTAAEILSVSDRLSRDFRKSILSDRDKTVVDFFHLRAVFIPFITTSIIVITLVAGGMTVLNRYALNTYKAEKAKSVRTIAEAIGNAVGENVTVTTKGHFATFKTDNTSYTLCFNNDGTISADNQNSENNDAYFSTISYETTNLKEAHQIQKSQKKYKGLFSDKDIASVKLIEKNRLKKDSVSVEDRVVNGKKYTVRTEMLHDLIVIEVYKNNGDFDYESYKKYQKSQREKARKREEKKKKIREKDKEKENDNIQSGTFYYDGIEYKYRVKRYRNGYWYWYYTDYPEGVAE